jgi:hypothetical protein
LRVENVPVKAILLALLLFVVGSVLLIVGSCVLTGVIDARHYWPESSWQAMSISFIVLGSITFLPGAYMTRIAYCAYHNREGYSFSQIPAFE